MIRYSFDFVRNEQAAARDGLPRHRELVERVDPDDLELRASLDHIGVDPLHSARRSSFVDGEARRHPPDIPGLRSPWPRRHRARRLPLASDAGGGTGRAALPDRRASRAEARRQLHLEAQRTHGPTRRPPTGCRPRAGPRAADDQRERTRGYFGALPDMVAAPAMHPSTGRRRRRERVRPGIVPAPGTCDRDHALTILSAARMRSASSLKAEESIDLHDERAILQRGEAGRQRVALVRVDHEQLAPRSILPPEPDVRAE